MTNNLQRYSSYWSNFGKISKTTNTVAKKEAQYSQYIQNQYLKSGLSLGNLIAQAPAINQPIFRQKRSLQFLQHSISTQNGIPKQSQNASQFRVTIKHQQWFARVLYYFLLHYLFESSENFDQAKKNCIANKWKSIVHKLQTDSAHDSLHLNCWKPNLISISDAKVYFFKFLKVLSKNALTQAMVTNNSKRHIIQQINISPKIDPVLIYIIKASVRSTTQNYKDLTFKNAIDFLKVLGFEKVSCQQFNQSEQKQNLILKFQANDFIVKVKACDDKQKRNKSKVITKSQSNDIQFSIQQPPVLVSKFYDSQTELLDHYHLENKIAMLNQQNSQCYPQGKNPQELMNITDFKRSMGAQSEQMSESLQHRDTVSGQMLQNSSMSSLKSPLTPFVKRAPNFTSLHRKDTILSDGGDSEMEDSVVIPMVAKQIIQKYLGIHNQNNKSNTVAQKQYQNSVNNNHPKIQIHFSKDNQLDQSQDFNDNQMFQRGNYPPQLQSNSNIQNFGNQGQRLDPQFGNFMKPGFDKNVQKIQQLRNMYLNDKSMTLFPQQNQDRKSKNSKNSKNSAHNNHPYIGRIKDVQFCKSEEQIKYCNDNQSRSKTSKQSKKSNQLLQIPDIRNIEKKNRKYSENISFNSPSVDKFLQPGEFQTPIQAVKQSKLRKMSADYDPFSLEKIFNSNRAKTAKIESVQCNSSQNDKRVKQFRFGKGPNEVNNNQMRSQSNNKNGVLGIELKQPSCSSYKNFQNRGFQSPQQRIPQQNNFGFTSQRISLNNQFSMQSPKHQSNNIIRNFQPQIPHPQINNLNAMQNQVSPRQIINHPEIERRQNATHTQIRLLERAHSPLNRIQHTTVQNPNLSNQQIKQSANLQHQVLNRNSVYSTSPLGFYPIQRNSLDYQIPVIKQKQTAATSQELFSERIVSSFNKPVNHYEQHQLDSNVIKLNQNQNQIHQQSGFIRSNPNALYQQIHHQPIYNQPNHNNQSNRTNRLNQSNMYYNNFKEPVIVPTNPTNSRNQFKTKSQIYNNNTAFQVSHKLPSQKQLNATLTTLHVQRKQKGKISLKDVGNNKKHTQNRKTTDAHNKQHIQYINPASHGIHATHTIHANPINHISYTLLQTNPKNISTIHVQAQILNQQRRSFEANRK